MTRMLAALAAAALASCASGGGGGGGSEPRPPQGPGPGGTDFGRWARDAEGAVDAEFRRFVTARYGPGDAAAARADLERDGFECKDGNRPDGRPVPALECLRQYERNEEVHAWSVQFWPDDREPRARYTRTHLRNPFAGPDKDR